MSWDIYGNPLRRGYCEVHPNVHEEYPCSICMAERNRPQINRHAHEEFERLQYEFAQQGDYIRQLESDRVALAARVAALESAVVTALRGTQFDEAGNREDDGLIPFGNTNTAIRVLTEVEAQILTGGA